MYSSRPSSSLIIHPLFSPPFPFPPPFYPTSLPSLFQPSFLHPFLPPPPSHQGKWYRFTPEEVGLISAAQMLGPLRVLSTKAGRELDETISCYLLRGSLQIIVQAARGLGIKHSKRVYVFLERGGMEEEDCVSLCLVCLPIHPYIHTPTHPYIHPPTHPYIHPPPHPHTHHTNPCHTTDFAASRWKTKHHLRWVSMDHVVLLPLLCMMHMMIV